jgi:hypothetical protein
MLSAYYNGAFIGSGPGDSWRDKYQSAAVILNVNIPLLYFDHGQLDNNARIAMLTRDQARDDVEEQKERIQFELRQLVIGLDQANNRLKSLPSVDLASSSLQQAEASLVASGSSQQIAQATNARNSWRLAKTAQIEALARLLQRLLQHPTRARRAVKQDRFLTGKRATVEVAASDGLRSRNRSSPLN